MRLKDSLSPIPGFARFPRGFVTGEDQLCALMFRVNRLIALDTRQLVAWDDCFNELFISARVILL